MLFQIYKLSDLDLLEDLHLLIQMLDPQSQEQYYKFQLKKATKQ